MKKLFLFLLLIDLIPFLSGIDRAPDLRGSKAVYGSPEGILYISYSKNWDKEKLTSLHQDLLTNTYGKELETLEEIHVEAKRKREKEAEILGTYEPSEKIITLWGGDERERVEEVSHTLSHEYGHHFTFFYVHDLYSKKSEWAKIRGLNGYPIRWKEEKLPDQHMWNPSEILAEDYVALYGRKREMDTQLFEERKDRERDTLYEEEIIGLYAHENPIIPPVQSDEKIHDYWEKTTGIPVEKEEVYLKTPLLITQKTENISPKTENYQVLRNGVFINRVNPIFTFTSGTDQEKKELYYRYEMIWFDEMQERSYFNGQKKGDLAPEQPARYYGKIKGVLLQRGAEPVTFNYRELLQKGHYGGTTEIGGQLLIQVAVINPRTNQVVYSKPYLFDFEKNRYSPELVPIEEDTFRQIPMSYSLKVYYQHEIDS